MKVEIVDLHGHNRREARDKVEKNIDWALGHGIQVLVITHGKGHHSSGFAVLKSEIRQMLADHQGLRDQGYRIIFGESNLPIALTYDEGHTLVVARGLEKEFIGGVKEQHRNQQIFSEESREERKARKRWRRDL